MRKGDELQERLIKFGVTIIGLSKDIPRSSEGRNMVDQLIRSATSAASNYAEARSAESLRDFVHKLGIVRKELNESYVWLRMLGESGCLKKETLAPILKECDELCRIISASKRTAEVRLNRTRLKQGEF